MFESCEILTRLESCDFFRLNFVVCFFCTVRHQVVKNFEIQRTVTQSHEGMNNKLNIYIQDVDSTSTRL